MPNVAATKAGQINAWACGATNLEPARVMHQCHCLCWGTCTANALDSCNTCVFICMHTNMHTYVHMAATCVLVAQTVSRVIIKTVQHCCKSGYINFRLFSSLKCTKTQPRRAACAKHKLTAPCLVAHQTKFLFYLLISQRHFFQALKAICWEFSEMYNERGKQSD